MRQPTRGAPPGPGFASVFASDVGPRLAAVNVDARAGQEAGLPRAHKRHYVRDLVHGSEAAHRHLVSDELRDALWIGLLPAGPTPPLPQNPARRPGVDRDSFLCGPPAARLDH